RQYASIALSSDADRGAGFCLVSEGAVVLVAIAGLLVDDRSLKSRVRGESVRRRVSPRSVRGLSDPRPTVPRRGSPRAPRALLRHGSLVRVVLSDAGGDAGTPCIRREGPLRFGRSPWNTACSRCLRP